MLSTEFRERFWAKVRMSDACWDWTGSLDTRGYGSFNVGNRRVQRAHRVAYELERGPIPKGEGHHGQCVLHSCDNRACVNPSHLFLGTHDANMADMVAKGRKPSRHGERNGRAVLTKTQAIAIRNDPRPCPAIAKDYAVNRGTVHRIKSGKAWAPA